MSTTPDLSAIGPFVPESFRALVGGRPAEAGPDGDAWLRALPALVRACAEQWDLRGTGPARHGVCAIVLPCEGPDGPAALKVTWPHPEARHEHLALRAWNGQGAVRLLAADPHRWALLLEPLEADRPLSSTDPDTVAATVGGLLRALDRPALPQLDLLSAFCRAGAARLDRDGPGVLPRRLQQRAAGLLREFASTEDLDDRLVHTDLHGDNVLAGARAPWLAIDPKPLAGVPEFGVAPLVWNQRNQALSASSVRDHLRRRVEIACAAGDLDLDLAMLWTACRCALNAVWDPEDHDWVSWQITVCTAMQE